jgi:hypothetical protein
MKIEDYFYIITFFPPPALIPFRIACVSINLKNN